MSTAILNAGHAEVAPVAPDGASIISMIARAASDPAVSIDKMERLFAMHQQMEAEAARRAFATAFAAMQPELPTIGRNGNIKTNEKDDRGNKTGKQVKQSSYALWEDIDEAARPVYTRHGFSLSFRTSQTSDRLTVKAVLMHRDGHSEENEFSSPIDTSGSKNNVQGWGSAMSYAKRYAATGILNIVTRGQDDDGVKAGAITPEDAASLREKMAACGLAEPRFCQRMDIASVDELPANRYDEAERRIMDFARAKGATDGR